MLLRTCKVVGVAEEWEHCAEGTSGLEGLVRVFLTEVRTLQSLETALHGATETGASTAYGVAVREGTKPCLWSTRTIFIPSTQPDPGRMADVHKRFLE